MNIVKFDTVVILPQSVGWLVTNTFRFPLRWCLPIETGLFIEVENLTGAGKVCIITFFRESLNSTICSVFRACYGSVAVLALSSQLPPKDQGKQDPWKLGKVITRS